MQRIDKMMRKQERFIKKKDSAVIYAVAALLMICHHLYGFPERFSVSMIPAVNTSIGRSAMYLGYYAKICVALYAFVSGYGMLTKWNTEHFKQHMTQKKIWLSAIRQSAGQAVKFYTRYWLVLCVFLLLGIILGKRSFYFPEFIKNMVGISSSYNAECWYVLTYIVMLILFPFLLWVMKISEKRVIKIIFTIAVSILMLLLLQRNVQHMTYIICFWAGMLLAEWKVLECLPKWNGVLNLFIAGICIVVSIGLKFTVSIDHRLDFLSLIPLIYGIVILNHNSMIPDKLKSGFEKIGKYSIYIWLIHTFFLYYYFQNLLLKLQYSIVIYGVTLIISLICGYFIDKLYGVLKKLFIQ